mgnify:CR=1
MKRITLSTLKQAIEEIRNLVEMFPSGVDYDADPADTSPSDATAHTAGLIWKICEEALPSSKKVE